MKTDDLASKLYEANTPEPAKEQPVVDELGIPYYRSKLDGPDNRRCRYEYITARCFKRNSHLHTRPDQNLYNSHTLIQPTLEDIAQLADWVDPLPRQAVLYIYNRLKELAPRLDLDILAITPTLGWNLRTQSFCYPPKEGTKFNVISDW